MGNSQNKQRRKISSHLERDVKPEASVEDGKPVDPRLIALLEFFDELLEKNHELFSKIFPKMLDEHMETIKKFKVNNIVNYKLNNIWKIQKSKKGKANIKMKGIRMMRKSSSIGSPRELSRDIGGRGEELKLERFKVKTVEIGLDDEKSGSDGGKKTTSSGAK